MGRQSPSLVLTLLSSMAFGGCATKSEHQGSGSAGGAGASTGSTSASTTASGTAGSGMTDSATAMIGPAGGTLKTDGGVVVDIPPGALASTTTITATQMKSAPKGAVGPVYELGPDG